MLGARVSTRIKWATIFSLSFTVFLFTIVHCSGTMHIDFCFFTVIGDIIISLLYTFANFLSYSIVRNIVNTSSVSSWIGAFFLLLLLLLCFPFPWSVLFQWDGNHRNFIDDNLEFYKQQFQINTFSSHVSFAYRKSISASHSDSCQFWVSEWIRPLHKMKETTRNVILWFRLSFSVRWK